MTWPSTRTAITGPIQLRARRRRPRLDDILTAMCQRAFLGSDDRHRDGLDGDDDDALVQYVVVLDVGPHGQRSGGSAAVDEHGGVRQPLHGQQPLLVEVVDRLMRLRNWSTG